MVPVVEPVGGVEVRPVEDVEAVVIDVEEEVGILTAAVGVGSDSVRQPPRTASNRQTERIFLESGNENPPGS